MNRGMITNAAYPTLGAAVAAIILALLSLVHVNLGEAADTGIVVITTFLVGYFFGPKSNTSQLK